jgi:hypothetical protein
MTMIDFTEKRGYERIPVDYTGTIDLDTNESIEIDVENVSKTGMLFKLSAEIKTDKPFRITITKKDSPLEPVKATGKIVWRHEDKNNATAGIHFSQIRWSETDRLIHNLLH